VTKSQRLRILRISHSATVTTYRDRERALAADASIDLALIYPSDWPHLGGDNEAINESFRTRSAGTFLTGSIPLFAYNPAPIISVVKWFKPDVIDVHEEPYSLSCFECLKLAQIFSPHAAFVFYSAQNINKRYPPPFRQTEQYVYSHSQGAYPCSIGVRDVLIEKGFRQPCPVIPLGLDPITFSEQGQSLFRRDLTSKRFVVGFTGRLEKCKGIEFLFQSVSLLRDRLPDSNIIVLIAGAGKDEDWLRSSATQLGIDRSIRWLGEVSASDMPSFYRSCDVVVVPSLTTKSWREQFGRAPVESMACGVPVVVSDSGSLPEVVADSAIIVPEGNHAAIADAIERLIVSPESRNALITRGSRLVQERYTWTKVASSMRELYVSAVRIKSGTSQPVVASID
jgi:glycosyltransferase involved in cell wall biosynthesis